MSRSLGTNTAIRTAAVRKAEGPGRQAVPQVGDPAGDALAVPAPLEDLGQHRERVGQRDHQRDVGQRSEQHDRDEDELLGCPIAASELEAHSLDQHVADDQGYGEGQAGVALVGHEHRHQDSGGQEGESGRGEDRALARAHALGAARTRLAHQSLRQKHLSHRRHKRGEPRAHGPIAHLWPAKLHRCSQASPQTGRKLQGSGRSGPI